MQITRKHRVRILPVVSVSVALIITAGMLHGIMARGEPAGPLLLWVGLPAALLLVYAAFALRRIERRGDEIRWGRVRLRHTRQAKRCEVKGRSHRGGRGWHLTVELVAHGKTVLNVTTINDDGKADAKAQRIAEALELRYTRIPAPEIGS